MICFLIKVLFLKISTNISSFYGLTWPYFFCNIFIHIKILQKKNGKLPTGQERINIEILKLFVFALVLLTYNKPNLDNLHQSSKDEFQLK